MGDNLTTLAATAFYSDVRNTYNNNFELVQKSFADGAEPTGKVVGQWWMDTTSDKMKFYNDSAWHSIISETTFDSVYTFVSGIIVDGDIECGKNISCSGYIKTGSNILCGSNIYASGLLSVKGNIQTQGNIYASGLIKTGSNIQAASNIYASGDIVAGDKMTAGSGFVASTGGYIGLPVHASTPAFSTKGYLFFDDIDDKVKVNDATVVKTLGFESLITKIQIPTGYTDNVSLGNYVDFQSSTASVINDGGWFDATTNLSVIKTVNAGTYRVNCQITIDKTKIKASGEVGMILFNKSSQVVEAIQFIASNYSYDPSLHAYSVVNLASGASLCVRILHTCGSTINLHAGGTNLTVERIK